MHQTDHKQTEIYLVKKIFQNFLFFFFLSKIMIWQFLL